MDSNYIKIGGHGFYFRSRFARTYPHMRALSIHVDIYDIHVYEQEVLH